MTMAREEVRRAHNNRNIALLYSHLGSLGHVTFYQRDGRKKAGVTFAIAHAAPTEYCNVM